MSAATKRKHVVKEVLDDFVLPEGDQQIVRVYDMLIHLKIPFMLNHLEERSIIEALVKSQTVNVYLHYMVFASRGNNLHEVEDDRNEKFLVSMPTKFRKNVWIKRGDYVLVDPISEGDKVKAEIVNILYKEQIKYIKDEGKWPAGFSNENDNKGTDGMIPDDMLPPSDSDSDEDEHLGDKVINTNRPTVVYEETDSSDNSEDEND